MKPEKLGKNPYSNDSLTRGVTVSFGLHAVLVAFFTVKAAFFTPETIDYSQAIQVDMVALPDKNPPALTPASPAPAPSVAPKPAAPTPAPVKAEEKPKTEPVKLPPKKTEEAVNLEKVKDKQQSAIDKLKAMEALERIKDDHKAAEEKKALDQLKKTEAISAPIKGNVISPGNSLTGLTKLQHDSYVSDLDRHIKQNWALPEWLAKRDLAAQALVQIDSRGNILSRKIIKSSGNPSYDEEVLATIDRSAPFPQPPEKFIAILSVDGIRIGFPE